MLAVIKLLSLAIIICTICSDYNSKGITVNAMKPNSSSVRFLYQSLLYFATTVGIFFYGAVLFFYCVVIYACLEIIIFCHSLRLREGVLTDNIKLYRQKKSDPYYISIILTFSNRIFVTRTWVCFKHFSCCQKWCAVKSKV